MEDRIKMCFNQSSATYDTACTIQQFSNMALLKILLHYVDINEPIHKIVDLGCGTGNSTQLLLETFKCQELYGIDIAEQLLKIAETKLKTSAVKFIRSSFNHPLTLTSLDLAYANMSLHWATSLENTLKVIHKALKERSFFSFSIPVLGTFNEIKSKHKNIFFPRETIESIIQQQSEFSLISTQKKTFIDKFSSPYQALKSIKNVGANILSQQQKKGLANKNLYANIFKEKDVFDLTYQVGFFILKK